MKTKTFTAVAKNAYGKPLPELKTESGTPVPASVTYNGEYTAYTAIEEVKAANDLPNDTEVVKFRNAQRKGKARAAAAQAKFDELGIIKPTIENDPQMQLKGMYDIFVAAKKTPEEARALASAALGIEWEDDED